MNTSLEMNFARNILLSIMSSSYSIITSPFMDPIDHVRLDFKDYLKIIKEPICLNQMKAKMEESEYQNIKEFICDFRLMLFNCYRYFGCDSKMGKLATKLESMFEQKLILLPIDVRVKTSLDAILMDETQTEIVESGMLRRRCADRSLSTDIRLVTPIKAIMDELEKFGTISSMFSDNTEFQNDPINYLIDKLRKWQEKRRNLQLVRTFDEWFFSNVSEIDWKTLNNSAEFIQFVQFISAAFQGLGLDLMLEEHLKLSHITIEDLEYALLFPQSSRLLCALVPLITTTSKNRQTIIKHGLWDYDSWNKEISDRIRFLYKQWNEKQYCDNSDLFVKRYSVDPILFKVLGNRKPVTDKKQFHEISIFQRCHILMALCCMSLRLQDTIHFGMDKTIEWDDHRVELLAEVGKYEYVRFRGLGEFASYFIYRIETRKIDGELAKYCVKDSVTMDNKRKRKEKAPNKYRMPTWYSAEIKRSKSKKSLSTNKRKGKANQKETDNSTTSWTTRSKSFIENETPTASKNNESNVAKNDDSIIEKTEPVEKSPEEIKIENIPSETTSMSLNEDDDTIDVGGTLPETEDEEEEIPEITTAGEDELKLIARDLAGVVTFKNEIQQKIDNKEGNKEELEGYERLLQQLCIIQLFFEANESNRKEKCNQSRLTLRLAIEIFENKTAIDIKEEKAMSKSDTKESCSEFESESSSERYTESEIMASITPKASRAERLARRLKRKLSDVDSNQAKRPKLEPSTQENCQEQSQPENQSNTPQQVKKKVYRICDDYFTEDLEPVQINEDGTLLHLSKDLISNDRYELARKMITMYKLKTNTLMSSAPNGTRPLVSSSS